MRIESLILNPATLLLRNEKLSLRDGVVKKIALIFTSRRRRRMKKCCRVAGLLPQCGMEEKKAHPSEKEVGPSGKQFGDEAAVDAGKFPGGRQPQREP